MGRRVDFFQKSDRDLGVNLGGIKSGMAKLLLDKADVCPVFQHEGCTSVPQEVARAFLANVGSIDVIPHHLSEAVRGEGFKEVR